MSQDPQAFTISSNTELRISGQEIIVEDSWGVHRTAEPLGIRYGTIPIDLYHLRLGYNYKIQLLTEENETISIPFKSYLNIGRTKTFERYNTVIDTLWEVYFNEYYDDLVNKYNDGMDIVFEEKYALTGYGLHLNSRNELIPFDQMSVDERFDHFIVNSTKDPKLYTNIYYLSTWNAVMIYSLLEAILKDLG